MSAASEEGFICPYCLVGFGSSSKLQGHFIEMHSDDSNPQGRNNDTSHVPSSNRLGHTFKVVHHSRPKTCDSCGEIIWQDAIICEICQVTLHTDQCEDEFTQPCTSNNQDSSGGVANGGEGEEPRQTGPAPSPRGLLPFVRRQVARQGEQIEHKYPRNFLLPGRDRYVNEEFDLDLTYITERIIAMSFPATGMETAYRNNLKDVAKMLRTKHEENYMIFNLSERSYDITNFNNQVLDFGWPDHLAPSLERLSSVCKSIKSWLDSDPSHVAVVHCKGGKGRTGCVIAAFMHYSEICHSAEAALDRFAMKRFYDSKCGGVTQPSQRKYVHYFADLLAGRIDLQSPPITLQHVIMHGIPNFDGKGGCRPFLKIYENMTLIYTSGLYLCQSDKERVKISIYGGMTLKGEVLIKCFHKKSHGMEPIFRCQFHSAVVGQELRMVYSKGDLDDAFKEKRFDESIRVELLFDNGADEYPDDSPFADVRSSLLDGKQQGVNNGSPNGNGGLDDDVLAKRNSYASFRGGYDSGMPGDDPPDMIDLESPKVLRMSRDRCESTQSFQMDPSEIKRFEHPQSSEIYTVVHKSQKDKPPKPEEKPLKHALKPHKSSSDVPNGSIFELFDKSDRKAQESSPSLALAHSSNKPPSRPPLPSSRKPPQASSRPTKPLPQIPAQIPLAINENLADESVYEEVPDDLSPSPGSLSPDQTDGSSYLKQIKPTKQSPEHIPLTPQHQRAAKPRPIRPAPPTKPTPKPKPSPDNKSDVFQEELTKQLLKQHLQKKRDSARGPSPKEDAKTNTNDDSKKQPLSPKHFGHPITKHRPSYAQVKPNQEIIIQPVPNRTSAIDNDMWVQVKFPVQPKTDSLGRRSSSSGNLTLTSNSGSDFYSNLAELEITPGAEEGARGDWVSERKDSLLHQRSHSFSGVDKKLVIKATHANRDSIIPVSTMTDDEPEYKNLEYAPDGTLLDSSDPPPSSQPNSTCEDGGGVEPLPPDELKARKAMLAKLIAAHNYENTALSKGEGDIPVDGPTDEDYMNQLPEGLFHTYSNQDELLEQLRTAHQPMVDSTTVPSDEASTPEAAPQRSRLGSGASFLKFLNSLRLLNKPKQQTIKSANVTEEERVKTLAPFEISGISIGHVNRDYEAFLRTSAWGNDPGTSGESRTPDPVTSNEGGHRGAGHTENKESGHSHEPSNRPPPPKPERPKNLAPPAESKESSNPVQQKKYRRPQNHNSRENQLSTPETPLSNRLPSPPVNRRHQPLAKKPSGPHIDNPPHLRSHAKLQATSSDAPLLPKPRVKHHNRHSEVPALPPPRAEKVGGASGEGYHHGHGRSRGPPPKPPPYDKTPHTQKPSESTVKSLMPYWYRPNSTREEAIDFVRPLDPGSFIVRDSQTVQGGYALTLKISEEHVRRRKKLSDDAPITEDMLVTHFLIQPDPEGVKLQGWNERAFKSLPEFIAHHTVEKLCMPCKLTLPRGSAQPQVRRKPTGIQQALQTGAACNLVYLGTVDVSSQGDDTVLAETIEQLRSLDLSMNIVTFKASRDGVTLTDNVNGMYIRRQYPISSITYCSLDPNDTRWDFPGIQHGGEVLSLRDKPCFGIVFHPQDGFGHSCLVFAEFDSTQPVTSVVNFVQKVMKEHKLANRHAQR